MYMLDYIYKRIKTKMKSQFKLGTPTKISSVKKRWLLLAGILIITLALAVIYWFVLRDKTPVDQNTTDPTIQSAKDSTENSPGDKESIKVDGSDATSEQVPESTSISVDSIDFNQSSGFVNSSAIVSGSSQEGTCVFSFTTTDGRPVVKESKGSSTCSVKISEVEFDKIGEWDLSVTFYSQNSKAAASRKVMIN